MFKSFSLNIKGVIHEYSGPQVMGIINVTPDSFYSISRTNMESDIQRRVEEMIGQGADFLDLGGYSSRPGAEYIAIDEEIRRLETGMKIIRKVSGSILVSVDTFRSKVAEHCIRDLGADIINDISGGSLDPFMYKTIAELKVPYILMHMRGTPATMSGMTVYDNVTADVIREISLKLRELRILGVSDVIIDPGFGFSKTLQQNFDLMRHLDSFATVLNEPLLVGISRKSMITKTLDCTPEEALNGTTVLNTIALSRGASILRVHDVRKAVETVKLYNLTT